jgi:hypothetical protein
MKKARTEFEVQFLHLKFKVFEFEAIISEAYDIGFLMTLKHWIETTGIDEKSQIDGHLQ